MWKVHVSDEPNKLSDDLSASGNGASANGDAPNVPVESKSIEDAPGATYPSDAVSPEALEAASAELPGEGAPADVGSSENADAVSAEAAEPEESGAEAAEPEATESAAKPAKKSKPAAEEGESESKEIPEKAWYILKVQSNREDSIREALERRIAIAGLQDYFDEIIVPTEMVSEVKNGKKRVVKRKLYPGYIVAHMAITEDTWFLVRETPGVGDFTGAGNKPTPMSPHEVSRILAKQEERTDEAPKLKIGFRPGDRVKIKEGTFENFE